MEGRAARSAQQQEDRELLWRYHKQGDASARERLIARHLPLVRSLARRYAGRGEPLEDIEQVGAIGLIKAIDRFDLEREVSLATYATPNVVGEIKRHFRDKGWAIRVPRSLQELNAKMSGAIEDLTARLGRSPSVSESRRKAVSRAALSFSTTSAAMIVSVTKSLPNASVGTAPHPPAGTFSPYSDGKKGSTPASATPLPVLAGRG